MQKFRMTIFVLILLASTFVVAQDSKVAVFGGWQFLSIDTSNSGVGRQNTAKGWDADVAFKVVPHISAVADFSGSYKSLNGITTDAGIVSPYVHVYNFLFGPRISAKAGKVSPFAEAMFGFNRTSVGASASGVNASVSDNGLGVALGGGLDYNLTKRLSVRLLKFDYLLNKVSDSDLGISSQTLNHLRISAGLVCHF
jgi:opacity protein-like surface antigen